MMVCLFVRTLKGKQLERSTPNLVHVYSIAVAWHALTHRSKGQKSHGYKERVTWRSHDWRPCAAAAACVGLHVDTTVFVLIYYAVFGFIYFLTYLSTPFRIQQFSFQAGGRRRRPNLALFCVLIISLQMHVCFSFVVFDLVFQYSAKRLAGKNVSEMTCCVSVGT